MIGALVFVAACAVAGAAGGAVLRWRARRDAPYWSGVCAALDLPSVVPSDPVAFVDGKRVVVLYDQDHEPEPAA